MGIAKQQIYLYSRYVLDDAQYQSIYSYNAVHTPEENIWVTCKMTGNVTRVDFDELNRWMVYIGQWVSILSW